MAAASSARAGWGHSSPTWRESTASTASTRRAVGTVTAGAAPAPRLGMREKERERWHEIGVDMVMSYTRGGMKATGTFDSSLRRQRLQVLQLPPLVPPSGMSTRMQNAKYIKECRAAFKIFGAEKTGSKNSVSSVTGGRGSRFGSWAMGEETGHIFRRER